MDKPIGVRTHGVDVRPYHRCTGCQFATAADLDRCRGMRERIENIQRVALKCVSFGICIPRIDLVPVGSPIGGKGFFLRRPLSHLYRVGCAEPGQLRHSCHGRSSLFGVGPGRPGLSYQRLSHPCRTHGHCYGQKWAKGGGLLLARAVVRSAGSMRSPGSMPSQSPRW